MRIHRPVAALAATAVLLGACSTTPRRFDPHLVAAGPDSTAVDAAMADCRTQVAAGRTSFGDRVMSGGAGTAAGYGAGAVVAPAVIMSGSAAAAAATLVLMPVVGVAVGIGISRSIRAGKERKIKAALSACMTAKGYQITSWSVAPKARGQ